MTDDVYAYDEAKKILTTGTFQDLQRLRVVLLERKGQLEICLNLGKQPDAPFDPKGRSKMVAAVKTCDGWLSRIRLRMGETRAAGGTRSTTEVKLFQLGTDRGPKGVLVKDHLDDLLVEGWQIFTFSVLGNELIVVGRAPAGVVKNEEG